MNTPIKALVAGAATVLTAAGFAVAGAAPANAYTRNGMLMGSVYVNGGTGIGVTGSTGGGGTYRVVPGGKDSTQVGILDANSFTVGSGYIVLIQIKNPATGWWERRASLGAGTHPIGNSDYSLTAVKL